MKYTVHLTTGATISAEIEDEVNVKHTLLSRGNAWLVDKNGVTIRAESIIAMVPIDETAPASEGKEGPEKITDGEGDV